MENRFQEAKSNIVNTLVRQIGFEAYKNLYEKEFNTLQELIDNYSKTLDLSNEEDKNTYILRLENAYREHTEKIEKLEKALDKACEQIANRGVIEDICANRKVKCKYYEQCTNNIDFACPINHWSSNEWKEYLLNEVQDGK